ncbi:MAG: DUF3021 domain-containing protein [Lacrimispora sp.]|uniref:DUF3021 domain-containing protein n=1 Tax=Lacrimispora sp. TaxID=2719234 RepID=UPI0039E6FCE8
MKTTVKNILLGIGLGSTLFVIAGIIFDLINAGDFQLSNRLYTEMAVGAMIVGIGFSVPSPIYDNDKLPLGIQTVIHMGIGCTIFLIVAFRVGWIPIAAGWKACVLTVMGQLMTAFLIWLIFALYYKRLAKKMNDRINTLHKS